MDRGDLQRFVDKCILTARKQPVVPDNIILHYENISPDKIPATVYFHSQDEEVLQRFILKNGMGSVSIRRKALRKRCAANISVSDLILLTVLMLLE